MGGGGGEGGGVGGRLPISGSSKIVWSGGGGNAVLVRAAVTLEPRPLCSFNWAETMRLGTFKISTCIRVLCTSGSFRFEIRFFGRLNGAWSRAECRDTGRGRRDLRAGARSAGEAAPPN